MASLDFVLEVGVEPLPARFVGPALDQLAGEARRMLQDSRLEFVSALAQGTPRRLVLLVRGLAAKSPALSSLVMGPPARLLRGGDGRFSPQAEGFARKLGLQPEELEVTPGPRENVLCARRESPGERASDVLARELPKLIAALKFPKTMEWEETRFQFARPIRWIVALHGARIVPLALAGVRGGRLTPGLACRRGPPLKVPRAESYEKILRNQAVLLDPQERRAVLRKRLVVAARAAGFDLDLDEALLEETVFTTEHPVPIVGRFREEFIKLPEALLASVMKGQLSVFPLRDRERPAAGFIAVRDGVSEGQSLVKRGYERVLEARLNDAAFFVSRDSQTTLESKISRLSLISFHRDAGSMADKAQRVARLTFDLAAGLGVPDAVAASAVKIAALAYADLASEAVKEFPELQGLMGGFYARQEGLEEDVAKGISQFYQPLGPSHPPPEGSAACLASLAGKIDTLACHFAVGDAPTAAADPFALRRQALGVVRIALERGLHLDLEAALSRAVGSVPSRALKDGGSESVLKELVEFLWGRAAVLFGDRGFSPEEIRSVRSRGLRDLTRALRTLEALREARRDPDFALVCAAFKRAGNILRGAPEVSAVPPERDQLTEPAERDLYQAIRDAETLTSASVGEQRFQDSLRELAALKGPLDSFFDNIMVMAEDRGIRSRRLALLHYATRLLNQVADLSELSPR